MTEMLTLAGPVPLASPSEHRYGHPAGDRMLVCKRVQRVTSDMKTFVFEPVAPVVPGAQAAQGGTTAPRDPGRFQYDFRHDPGQHLVFTFEIDGQETERRYSICSPPSRPRLVAITVKRVPGGLVSNWLHDHLKAGDTVRARGPFGHFSMARHPAPAYLFLSGGSGITPLMSMTRTLYDLASGADAVFVHSARTPEDIPFRQELELISGTMPNIRVVHVCEDGGASEAWSGHRGRLTAGLLRLIAPDFLEREVFTCGPPGYMRAVRELLAAAGFPMDRHHQETFGAAAAPTRPSAAPVDADVATGSEGATVGGATRFAVELSRSGRTIECDSATPVLEAAARAGITLPSSCGQGLCGSCMTTLEKGSVDMRHNGGIHPRDTARNKILLCCSTPRENLVIDA
ncbi:hybrid-cluster NAD(P)-dependent oxidoreductase [Streptomyces axinellae]|uniref:Hybrid-cluster NAD(P)-dependent oxidoreductase n=1 Tax=Streptomyces axinellae TaxID=552788 RepID=A0ABN3Q7G8_9ACTN